MQTWQLDDLLSAQLNNMKLVEGLKLIRPQVIMESLANYDDFEFAKFVQFRQIYRLEVENTITDAEPFPGEMMPPKKVNVNLPDDMYNLLVKYYNVTYDNLDFFLIKEVS